MSEPFEFDHDKFLETFARRCECGSRTFKLALEDIDMIPLTLPASQRVTCTQCGRYSIQTVSAEGKTQEPDPKPPPKEA
jgi:hypothetical protein